MRRLALILLFAIGCSSAETEFGNSSSTGVGDICAPGHQIACACAGGIQSIQVCAANGEGYGACECSDAGAGGMGGKASSSSSSSASTTGGTGGSPAISCVKQSDCNVLKDACHVGECINNACEKADAPDGTVCDDAQACTVGDHCLAGSCASGAPMVCPVPADACHVAFCDPVKQACTTAPGNDGAACDDGDPCTTDGTCDAGNCVNAPPISCAQLDTACTKGVCNPQSGCVSTPANEGLACDDGLFCTDPDACVSGSCVGKPRVCPAPPDVCMAASCDEVNNVCVGKPGNNGTFCDDGNVCTMGETCNAGTCGGGQPANGLSCNDGNACTANDVCANEVCGGKAIAACQNGDGCCPAGCSFANDNDCPPPCGGYVDPTIGGCWYLSALGDSCTNECSSHGGFDAAHAKHMGNPICTHFYPGKANGTNWQPLECCSTDNNTDWGATGAVPDPSWVNGDCYLGCACLN